VTAQIPSLDMTRVRVVTIAFTLEQYLGRNGIAYDVLSHAPTTSSLCTVEASHVPADALAKTVVLKGNRGYLLAVLPAMDGYTATRALQSAPAVGEGLSISDLKPRLF